MYEELNKKTAYIKDKPRMMNIGWSRDIQTSTYLIKRTLLSFGGDKVNFPIYDEGYVDLQTRGQLWLADRVKKLPKQQDYKTTLVQTYLHKKENLVLMRGYALRRGVWYYHVWIIETRPRKNILLDVYPEHDMYFGYALTEDESMRFCQSQAYTSWYRESLPINTQQGTINT